MIVKVSQRQHGALGQLTHIHYNAPEDESLHQAGSFCSWSAVRKQESR